MLIKMRNSVSVRTGLTILAGAGLLTVALSVFFYQRIFEEQLTHADRQLQQLVATMESSAAVAAYLDNEELATEVVRGLVSNDIVATASLQSESGMRAIAGDVTQFQDAAERAFPLHSPFMPDETIGSIAVHPNRALIENNAREVAQVYIATLVAHSLLLTTLTILLVHWRLARPLKSLTRTLHEIEPGSPSRVSLLPGHHLDEVGQLVGDINTLLEAAQLTLEGERRLRQYVESVERRFRLIFDHASCGIVLVDQHGKILFGNPTFSRIMGQDEQQTTQINFIHLFDDASHVRQLLMVAANNNSPVSEDLQMSGTRAGNARWLHALFSSVQNEQGELLVECILYDISERARREQETRQEAERDPLTQLYNRRAGERLLLEALEQARAAQQSCAVMLIDLDRFKPINDTYGHDAGDRVLLAVANRLVHSLRKQDVVIRWGGDEFVVLAFPGKELDSVPFVAEKLLQQLAQPVDLGIGHSDQVGASIGIALFPTHGQKLGDLIAKADKAMYQVKERGRNHYMIYQAPAQPMTRGG